MASLRGVDNAIATPFHIEENHRINALNEELRWMADKSLASNLWSERIMNNEIMLGE